MREPSYNLDVDRILRLIKQNSYFVSVEENRIMAADLTSNKVYLVTGDDPLTMAATLAELVGIDLLDG